MLTLIASLNQNGQPINSSAASGGAGFFNMEYLGYFMSGFGALVFVVVLIMIFKNKFR